MGKVIVEILLAELMLLGFISLLLTVFQSAISKMCVPEDAVKSMLPCKVYEKGEAVEGSSTASDIGYCATKVT